VRSYDESMAGPSPTKALSEQAGMSRAFSPFGLGQGPSDCRGVALMRIRRRRWPRGGSGLLLQFFLEGCERCYVTFGVLVDPPVVDETNRHGVQEVQLLPA
jgi:hypothetical protein